jgi:hypothetical protein
MGCIEMLMLIASKEKKIHFKVYKMLVVSESFR